MSEPSGNLKRQVLDCYPAMTGVRVGDQLPMAEWIIWCFYPLFETWKAQSEAIEESNCTGWRGELKRDVMLDERHRVVAEAFTRGPRGENRRSALIRCFEEILETKLPDSMEAQLETRSGTANTGRCYFTLSW